MKMKITNEDLKGFDDTELVSMFVTRSHEIPKRGENAWRNERSLEFIIWELAKRWEEMPNEVSDTLIRAFNLSEKSPVKKEAL